LETIRLWGCALVGYKARVNLLFRVSIGIWVTRSLRLAVALDIA
jgi:hypothetical protein